jgi:hypothetical protein
LTILLKKNEERNMHPEKKVVMEKLNKKIRTKALENGGVSVCPDTAI